MSESEGMNRSTNLIIWLIGLLGCAIPIVIIFVSNMVPNAGTVSGITFMDVARQSYANVLFLVIAVSGIAIAEAIILFFKMVEVGEQKPTPALWLLTMVLLIVFSSISYARVLGEEFDPATVSDQQLILACIGASVAILAALSLRVSMIRLEGVARQHIHDNAVMTTLEELRDSQDEHMDLYDFEPFPSALDTKEAGERSETRISDPPKRVASIPAADSAEDTGTKISRAEPKASVIRPAAVAPLTEAASEEPEPRLPETPAAPAVMPEKSSTKRTAKPAEIADVEVEVEAEPAPDTLPVPVSGNKVKRARTRARAKGR